MPESIPESICPACGSTQFKVFCPTSFLGPEDRHIVECVGCGLSKLSPMPTFAELEEYYSGVYFGWDRYREEGKGWFFAKWILGKRPKGKFLDIGCATGFFLNGVKNNSDWQVSGVEFSAKAVEYATKTLGLDVKQGTLDQAQLPSDEYDFIYLNNVIEHETQPFGLLAEAGRILKPGGELIVVMPNGRVDRQVYQDYFKKKGGKAGSQDGHLFFFSPDSLLKMVAKAGLKVKKVYSAGLIRGMRAVGDLPRTPTWDLGYAPRERRKLEIKVEESIQSTRRYSKAYMFYKHFKELYTRVPGFRKYGYDFHLHLTK